MKETDIRDFIQNQLKDRYDVITTKTRYNKHAALWAVIHPGGRYIITVEKVVGKNKFEGDMDIE